MRNRKRGGLCNRGVSQERLIDFTRGNLFGPPIDHIIFAAVNCKKAVFVKTADVPRFEPPIEKRPAIKLVGIKIAGSQCWTAKENFPLLARRRGCPSSPTIISAPGQGMPHVPNFEGPGGGRFAAICAASLEP